MAIEAIRQIDILSLADPRLVEQTKQLGPDSETAGPLFFKLTRQLEANAFCAGLSINPTWEAFKLINGGVIKDPYSFPFSEFKAAPYFSRLKDSEGIFIGEGEYLTPDELETHLRASNLLDKEKGLTPPSYAGCLKEIAKGNQKASEGLFYFVTNQAPTIISPPNQPFRTVSAHLLACRVIEGVPAFVEQSSTNKRLGSRFWNWVFQIAVVGEEGQLANTPLDYGPIFRARIGRSLTTHRRAMLYAALFGADIHDITRIFNYKSDRNANRRFSTDIRKVIYSQWLSPDGLTIVRKTEGYKDEAAEAAAQRGALEAVFFLGHWLTTARKKRYFNENVKNVVDGRIIAQQNLVPFAPLFKDDIFKDDKERVIVWKIAKGQGLLHIVKGVAYINPDDFAKIKEERNKKPTLRHGKVRVSLFRHHPKYKSLQRAVRKKKIEGAEWDYSDTLKGVQCWYADEAGATEYLQKLAQRTKG